MLENPMIVFGVAAILAMLAFIIGFSLGRGRLQALRLDRDRLQAFVDNAGIDLKGLRRIGQNLTTNAAAITTAAAKMVQLADNAEGAAISAKAEAIEGLESSLSSCAGKRNGNPCHHQLYRCSNCSKTGCETYGNIDCTNEGFHDGKCVSCGRSSKASA